MPVDMPYRLALAVFTDSGMLCTAEAECFGCQKSGATFAISAGTLLSSGIIRITMVSLVISSSATAFAHVG
jgi:hypothetical protein